MTTPEPLVHLDGDHPMVQILLVLDLPQGIKLMAGQLLNQLLEAPDLDSLHYSAGTGNGYALGVMAAAAVDEAEYSQLVDLYEQAANYRAEEKGWL
ncbi:hypothetical protein [Pseudomonas sp. NMI1173_11]|uniref:hypothetical protein n=1 Tax=Pseudomonas sp. NMI1173_11 TaxID=2903145 RepID=UPI001E516EFB|nr:hypothetical protein [Pseudomonas sp. NMI1173_11]MCE1004522.1 hypothetical protein [Pseudomonas sp. NMI1173_11]